MIKALDLYLAGDGRYCDWLTDSLRMVFEMLRFDVDKAIERSARARARRRSPRKVNKPAAVKANTEVKSKPITADTSLLFPDATTDTDEIKEEDIRIPRRLRRAAAHASRSKRRWQKIG